MTTKTLTWVSEIGTEPDKYGNLYVNVAFEDDTIGYIGSRAENIKQHHAALTALLDKPAEFILEDKGTSKSGKPKSKINGYPGWERQPDGGGGGGKSSWYNSEEGVRFTQDRMDRRTALMQAVVWAEGVAQSGLPVQGEVGIIPIADQFYTWLRASEPSASSIPAQGSGRRPSGGSDSPTGEGKGEGEAPEPSPVGPNLDSPATEEQIERAHMAGLTPTKMKARAKALFGLDDITHLTRGQLGEIITAHLEQPRK